MQMSNFNKFDIDFGEAKMNTINKKNSQLWTLTFIVRLLQEV